MTKIAIDSDFLDFYDHAFYSRYNADIVWERRSRTNMSKRKQFAFLEQQGLATPIHGTVMRVHEKMREGYLHDKTFFEKCSGKSSGKLFYVVVYLDEYVHRGLGKLQVPLKLALDHYPHRYCSQLIQTTPSSHAVSYRYLQVGKKSFWLRYTGHDSWMSNHAEKVDVEYLCTNEDKFRFTVGYPVFAIDFIPGKVLYAIDFNTAPGLKDTGIPLKDPHEIYELIDEWYRERRLSTAKEEVNG